MKNLRLILFLFIILAKNSYCQQEVELDREDVLFFKPYYFEHNNITINSSEELRSYLEAVASIYKKQNDFYGYRVKIFAANHREARKSANDLRLDFNQSQDTVSAYVVYLEPNFEVHVGDFRTRFEALALLQMLREDYPQSYVVRTIINFPEFYDEE